MQPLHTFQYEEATDATRNINTTSNIWSSSKQNAVEGLLYRKRAYLGREKTVTLITSSYSEEGKVKYTEIIASLQASKVVTA